MREQRHCRRQQWLCEWKRWSNRNTSESCAPATPWRAPHFNVNQYSQPQFPPHGYTEAESQVCWRYLPPHCVSSTAQLEAYQDRTTVNTFLQPSAWCDIHAVPNAIMRTQLGVQPCGGLHLWSVCIPLSPFGRVESQCDRLRHRCVVARRACRWWISTHAWEHVVKISGHSLCAPTHEANKTF